LIPLVLLAALELGLRLGGYGYPTTFFLESHQGTRPVHIDNVRFGWRFFPRPLARMPQPLVVPVDKPADTCRIFVFGESAAMGEPEPAYGFPRILKLLLEGRFPGRRFEVVNVAMTAINSNIILPIAQECARQQGDFWVVYMGNNEVVGPFGPGTVFGAALPHRTLLRLSLALKTTRVGQLLDAAVQRLRQGSATPQTWGGLEMFLARQIRHDDPRLEAVYGRFAQNLNDILRLGVDSGARVLVNTMVSNLRDCAPFGSLHSPGLSDETLAQWEKLYQTGSRLQEAGDFSRAQDALRQAAQLDPNYADLQFRLARGFESAGDYEEARHRFELARDLDTLRFRCDTRLNQILREVAGQRTREGIYLADAAREFARLSLHGVPGEQYLYEHVHFRFEGNYLLAGIAAQQIGDLLAPGRPLHPLPDWPTMSDCARRLALTGWNRYWLTESIRQRESKAPFTHQVNHADIERRLNRELAEWQPALAPAALKSWDVIYRQALAEAPADWQLHAQFAKLLAGFGDLESAVREWRQVIALVPQHAVAHYELGRLLDRGSTRSEAGEQLLQALRLWPDFPQALNSLGIVLAHSDKLDAACERFAQALQLEPDLADAQLNWAATLEARGRSAEALPHLAAAVQLQPDNVELRDKLALALGRQGRLNEAVSHLAKAVRLQPGFVAARVHLGQILAQQSKFAPALDQFREALRLDPTNQLAKKYFDKARELQGKKP
jgi:tetratricopeptide (TPR) repeat protein